jgi:hypothetical protein
MVNLKEKVFAIPTEYDARWVPESLWGLWRRQESALPIEKITLTSINSVKDKCSEIKIPRASETEP